MQAGGVEAALCKCFRHDRDDLVPVKVENGEIDRNRHLGRPSQTIAAGMPHNEARYVRDKPHLFGKLDENVGRDWAALR